MFDPVRPFAQHNDPKSVSLQDFSADPNGILTALRQGPPTSFSGGAVRASGFRQPGDAGPFRPQSQK